MRTRMGAALLAATALLAACSGELVGGGQRDVDAVATGDGTSGGSASLAPSYTFAPGQGASFQANGISGTIGFDARVSLVRGGRREQVNGPGSATVLANGRDTVLVVSGRVPRNSYTAARVVFTRVTANVTGGLSIGGTSVTGQVNVSIAQGDSVVVEMPVDLGDEDDYVRLLIDLDASAWLRAANPLTRTVPAATFQSAVKLRPLP